MGILTKETKKAFAEYLDKKAKFGNRLIEMVDGMVFGVLISIVDDKVFSMLDEDLHDELNETILAISEERYDDATDILDDILAGIIPTPLVDGTDDEQKIYKAILDLLVAFIPKG